MAIKGSDAINALTPLDGRYQDITSSLSVFLSEYGVIKTRIEVEAKYLIALSREGLIRKLTKEEEKFLLLLPDNITVEQALDVKQLEKETRHDVKAMERSFRKMLPESMKDIIEMIHFGLTSSDINNISFNLMLVRATKKVLIPSLEKIIIDLTKKADLYKNLPLQARTHGQAAVPTTLGKELTVYITRLTKQLETLKRLKLTGKLNGAVGNYNALLVAYPRVNWVKFSEDFVRGLDLTPNLVTTQINNYDDVAEFLQTIARINTILIALDQDIWRYISDGWFVQTAKEGEVGSSTMPQKVNPIDFENSEGNLGLANSIIEYMAKKLPISRLQRDLSDSTVVRNFGTLLGYSLVGYEGLNLGLTRIKADEGKIGEALDSDWSILTEAAQTMLRKEGTEDPYSLVAKLVRGKKMDRQGWLEFVNALPVKQIIKDQLSKLTPQNYTGLAADLTESIVSKTRDRK